jgi:hypothetical protein
MSISSINNNSNPLLQLQQSLQNQDQPQVTDNSSIGAAATLDLSSTSTSTASKASSGSKGGTSSTDECPQGKSTCTNCGQCGKTTTNGAAAIGGTSAQNNLSTSLSTGSNADYQTVQAINAYEKV